MTTDDQQIPPRLSPDEMPPFTDQSSVEHAWRSLMGELGFATPQLWLLFVDGDRPRHVLNVEDVPLHPGASECATLGRLVEQLVGGDRTCAFLYARPGGPGRTPGDLAWARALSATCDRWPVHLANDVELRVAAPDDLAATG
ncbi:hypothetical protein L615_008500000180 [Nocardioides sp. J9]|uniref:hypothetical protein n=1 Tax=unclassified Nocardioides TaxID=2615069 RepID=UPI0004B9EDEF|nr:MULTISPECIES: hypothetical protein [unclassified Nocardioides]TWG91024.1 hypothetical protein L615_008500000180 [Nocardioides sp. J9]